MVVLELCLFTHICVLPPPAPPPYPFPPSLLFKALVFNFPNPGHLTPPVLQCVNMSFNYAGDMNKVRVVIY